MTVTKFKATVVMAAVGVGLVLPLTVHHHAQAMLRIGDEKLRDEDKKLAILKTENASLSAMVEQTKPSVAGESSRSVELARLRNEVGTLMREVRAKSGSNEPVTLEEKAEARKQHIAEQAIHLRGWFEAHPEAMIPEFKVIGEESWQFSASQNELQTEHDLRRAAANLRANAEHAAFLDPIAGALRRYLKENNDRFPAELSQLTPYLRSPIDDAILQRYEIVPTTTLVPSLRVVGDWAITERAPVDSSMDSRQVVGARLGTFADERVVDRWTFKP